MAWPRRKGKFNNKRAVHGGRLYHSKKEADYARELDLRVRAKELKSWRRQVPFRLCVNGRLVCTYILDFEETDTNDNVSYTEVKGYETDVWRLKWILFEALYPDVQRRIVQ